MAADFFYLKVFINTETGARSSFVASLAAKRVGQREAKGESGERGDQSVAP